MRRELKTIDGDRVVGAVEVGPTGYAFTGSAGSVLRGLIERLGEGAAARNVIAEGWAGGALYFGDLVD